MIRDRHRTPRIDEKVTEVTSGNDKEGERGGELGGGGKEGTVDQDESESEGERETPGQHTAHFVLETRQEHLTACLTMESFAL